MSKFKLNGLHLLFVILFVALIIFWYLRPTVEGFDASDEQPQTTTPGILQSLSNASSDLYNDASSELSNDYNYVSGNSNNNSSNSNSSNGQSSGILQSLSTASSNLYNDASSELSNDYNYITGNNNSSGSGNASYSGAGSGSYIGPAGDTVIIDNPRQPMQQQQQQQPQPQPQQQPQPQPQQQSQQSQPLGIPRSQIPNGDEDMYILKSQVIPPVCPACPNVSACPRPAPYPPCPPCSRCPEPSFDCKKVPNYNSGTGNSYLPRPVLADFSQFGM